MEQKGKIYGIDLDRDCGNSKLAEEVRICAILNKLCLKEVANELGTVNVIIEDRSHNSNHQRKAFEGLPSSKLDWPLCH